MISWSFKDFRRVFKNSKIVGKMRPSGVIFTFSTGDIISPLSLFCSYGFTNLWFYKFDISSKYKFQSSHIFLFRLNSNACYCGYQNFFQWQFFNISHHNQSLFIHNNLSLVTSGPIITSSFSKSSFSRHAWSVFAPIITSSDNSGIMINSSEKR